MKILVVCPGCRKRFEVNEKFAGKTGPCPKCKTVIKVPDQSEQVVIHAPEEFEKGGRGQSGQLVLKPISRVETKFKPLVAAAIVAGAGLASLAAWFGGQQKLFENPWITAGTLLVLSPALVVAAYSFLRDDELEPYRGKELWLRAAICGGVYAALWGIFGYAVQRNAINPDFLWSWAIVVPPFVAVGAMAAAFSLDLDFGNATFHYLFYLLVTIFLRWAAGWGWVWNIPHG
jgi:hypothetical protein